MYKTPTEITLKWWPSLQDYNEVIQIPVACLQDLELKRGLPYTDIIGLPRPVTGSFASVYRMNCEKTDYALRLFLRNIKDQEDRYALISSFVQNDDLPYTVTFDFLKNGIKIRGEWMPALKMEWVEGVPFDDYLIANLANPPIIHAVLAEFLKMMQELHKAGIAHGDLQHGNMLMCGKEIRLVDYDGMFVPAMQGYKANELGHRNYQHPKRNENHFGPYLDNFSAWLIYTSVRALEIDSRLLHQLGGGDDCLLFRQTDFQDPINSAAFAALEKHENRELNELGRFVRAQLGRDLPDIPYLQLPLPSVDHISLSPVATKVTGVREGPRLIRGTLPEWLEQDNMLLFDDSPLGEKSKNKKQNQNQNQNPNRNQNRNQNRNNLGLENPSWVVSQTQTNAAWVKPAHSYDNGASTLASNILPTLPPELGLSNTLSNTARTVEYFHGSGKKRPETLQALMLLNPVAWVGIFLLFMAVSWDAALINDGVAFPATITEVFPGVHGASSVAYTYEVHGQMQKRREVLNNDNGKTKVGDRVQVIALPSHPDFTAGLCQAPVDKQATDFVWALLGIAFTLVCEMLIWFPAKRAKYIAQYGLPLIANVDKVTKPEWYQLQGVNTVTGAYSVTLSYQTVTTRIHQTLRINKEQYARLQAGTTEVILCNPKSFRDREIYKFCAYHPVLPISANISQNPPKARMNPIAPAAPPP